MATPVTPPATSNGSGRPLPTPNGSSTRTRTASRSRKPGPISKPAFPVQRPKTLSSPRSSNPSSATARRSVHAWFRRASLWLRAENRRSRNEQHGQFRDRSWDDEFAHRQVRQGSGRGLQESERLQGDIAVGDRLQ